MKERKIYRHDRCIGHALTRNEFIRLDPGRTGLHKVYDRYAYLNEKRHALDLWTVRLLRIVEPSKTNNGNVVPLRTEMSR